MWAALIGLIGGIVGAVLTALFNAWHERVRFQRDMDKDRIKWQRDEAARKEQVRNTAYATFIHLAMEHALEDVSVGSPVSEERRIRFMESVYTVCMIATDLVRKAAEKFAYEAQFVHRSRRTPGWKGDIDAALRGLTEAQGAFMDAARQERG